MRRMQYLRMCELPKCNIGAHMLSCFYNLNYAGSILFSFYLPASLAMLVDSGRA
jgi:hypothetical protein